PENSEPPFGRTYAMMNRMRALALGLIGATAVAVPAYAVDLDITCRCVIGGVNSATAQWLEEKVIPAFEAANPDINVTLNQSGCNDAQLTARLALAFSTGAAPDMSAFHGYLIPAFAEAGQLKSVDDLFGDVYAEWEGWNHIWPGIRSIMSYDGGSYGIGVST